MSGPPCPDDGATAVGPRPTVALTRTAQGWSVVSAVGVDPVGDLVEGLSLADLVAEELGGISEPDRTARRSARGPAPSADDAVDPRDTRLAALERTVAQLEHALAARVTTERAIGVLAERHRTSPRSAFDALRRDARSQGRAVHDLAREVLDGLRDCLPRVAAVDAEPPATRSPARSVPTATPRRDAVVASVADGRS